MNINLEYEIGKGKVAEFIADTDVTYNMLQEQLKLFREGVQDEYPGMQWFNEKRTVKFLRTWDIIKSDSITAAQRNLICAYEACGHNLDALLEFFNGKGKNIKNKASLNVLLSNARKAIETKYNELYGDN